MSKREAIMLVSRAFVVYLVLWALVDLSYLPGLLFSLIHHARELGDSHATESIHRYNNYLREADLIALVFHLAKLVGLSIMARWFYKGGAGVEALLLPPPQETEVSGQS